jgi:hypothetical protein
LSGTTTIRAVQSHRNPNAVLACSLVSSNLECFNGIPLLQVANVL